MKVFSVILLLGVVASCHGYSYTIPANKNQPGMCYFNGHALSRGESQAPTACQSLRCNDDGSILVQGCGRLNIKDCTLLGPTKNAAAYPDCCEMNYQCKDREGRLFMRQWNQLKDGQRGQDQITDRNARMDLQQSEAINAAEELLDQIRQEAQRDGRSDLGDQQQQQQGNRISVEMGDNSSDDELKMSQDGEVISEFVKAEIRRRDRELRAQINRVEEELKVLDQIKARQGQQGILTQEQQEQQRERVKTEMQTLVQIWVQKMGQGSQGGQADQELRAILSLFQEKLQRQGRMQSSKLRAQLNRVEEDFKILGQIKTRQSQQAEQGRLTQSQQDEQENEIQVQRGQVRRELVPLLEIWLQNMGQAGLSEPESRSILSLIEESIQRQGLLESEKLKEQLNRFERELDILEQIRARLGREGQQIQREQQRVRVTQAKKALLEILTQLMLQAGQGSQGGPSEREARGILSLIGDQIRSKGRLQSTQLRAQRKRVEDQLEILDQIKARDGQQGALIQAQQEQQMQRGRVEEELKTLVKLWILRMAEPSQGSQKGQSGQEVRAILSLVREQIQRKGREQSLQLRTKLNRVEEELKILDQIKDRQFQDGQQGTLIEAQQEQEIRMQRGRVEEELRSLVRILAQEMGQAGQEVRVILDLVQEQSLRQGRPQSSQLKAQLNRVERELKILDQIKARRARGGQQGTQEQQEQEIRLQRRQVEEELRTLLKIWAQEMGQPRQSNLRAQSEREVQAFLSFIREIQRNGRLQSSELRDHLNRVEVELQNLTQIMARQGREAEQEPLTQAQQQQQKQEIQRQGERVEAEWRTLKQIWEQEMGQGRQGSQGGPSEQEVQGILSLVREQIQRKGREQSSELRAQLNRVEEGLRIFDQIKARQQGSLSQTQGEQQQQEIRMQRRRIEMELKTLIQILAQGMGQAGQGAQSEQEVRAILGFVREQILRQGQGLQSSELRAQLNRVEEGLRILDQIKARQQGNLSQAQQEQQELDVIMQRRQVEEELKTLVKIWAQKMNQAGRQGRQGGQSEQEVRSILNLVAAQILRQGRLQSSELKSQFNRVEVELQILDYLAREAEQETFTQAQQEQQEQEIRMQRGQVEAEIRALVRIWAQRMDQAGQGSQGGQFKEELQAILSLIQEQILRQGRLQSLELRPQLNRVEEELKILDQIKARQAREIQQGTLNLAEQQQQEQELKMQRRRVEKELRELMQMWARGMGQGGQGSRGGISEEQARTILSLATLARREPLQSSELRARINRAEEELRILDEIKARQDRQAQQGILTQGEQQQQEDELRAQLRRINKELRDLKQIWTQRMGQAGQRGQGRQFEEEAALTKIFVGRQILRQGLRQSSELNAQMDRIDRELNQIMAEQGILTQGQQEKQQQQRVQIEKELVELIEMLSQELERDQGQGGRIGRNGQMQPETGRQQQQRERRLQREQLENDLKTVLEMLPQQGEQQQQGMMNFMRVKLLKSEISESSEVKAQRERLEKDLQTLVQLKARQSEVSKAGRSDYEREIKIQRERIENELRALMEIRAKEAAQEGRGLSIRAMEGKIKIEQEEDRRQDRLNSKN